MMRATATGTMLQEARYINLSLVSVSHVIDSLVNNKKFVPYRDSKLTYLFAHALGGNCNSVFIGNIASASYNCSETLSTLRFMKRIKNCINYPKQNINDKYSLLVQLDRIYNNLIDSQAYEGTVDAFESEIEDEMSLSRSPKDTIELLIDYLSSTDSSPDSFKLYSSFAWAQKGWLLSVQKFMILLKQLNNSFIKLKPIAPRELVKLISFDPLSLEACNSVHYQLSFIDSEIMALVDQSSSDSSESDLKQAASSYLQLRSELADLLLSRANSASSKKSESKQTISLLAKLLNLIDRIVDLSWSKESSLIKQIRNLSISI